ncbi:secretion protein HlyD family protein [Desulfurobacterium thermolithotrophum DSM 11699]|uniref:Secretion protein HlyD family protein n=1 Tax=Desulfurobacterium thermolithotrophum (strain DSM 11699 / BSA) TaxID=868864 RepID=F0S3T4_DESTD|nr:HlyD family secretion protein [Desulfurobacterium thermolithotrophum]ADY73506.1 secretion protein HlyD family protein [Desulfurobacterium thermolithotrophum DSM 11699]
MKKLFSIVGFLLIAFITFSLFYYFYQRHIYVITDDAFQMADVVSVSTQDASGKIVKLFKKEYESVSKEEPLFKVDDSLYRKDVEILKAKLESLKQKKKELSEKLSRLKEQLPADVKISKENLKALEKKLNQLKYQELMEKTNYETSTQKAESSLKAAEKGLEAAKVSFNHWKNQYNRYKRLYKKRIISKEQLEEVELAYKEALYKLESAKARLQAAKGDLENAKSLKNRIAIIRKQQEEVKNKIEALKEQVKISKANLKKINELSHSIRQLEEDIKSIESQIEKAKILLSHTLVKSPVEGFIAKKWKEEGDFISPGLPVYSIYNSKSFFVLAWIEEDKIKDIKVGNKVKVELEVCKKTFKGKVYSIGTSAGSIFSLIPRDTSQGEYTKVTQRIPVKIKVEKVPPVCIKPGTNVTVYIKKRQQ